MSLSQSARAALVVAHPSHELRVHGWLEQTRPYVCILTDGGGRSGDVRLPRTTEVVAHAGARLGAFYGRLSDLEVYSAILNRDADLFAGLVEESLRNPRGRLFSVTEQANRHISGRFVKPVAAHK